MAGWVDRQFIIDGETIDVGYNFGYTKSKSKFSLVADEILGIPLPKPETPRALFELVSDDQWEWNEIEFGNVELCLGMEERQLDDVSAGMGVPYPRRVVSKLFEEYLAIIERTQDRVDKELAIGIPYADSNDVAEDDPRRHNLESTVVVGELFRRESEKWTVETAHLSNLVEKCTHPSYQRIIGMGAPVLPHIFERLKRQPQHWFWALQAITGECPVLSSEAGNFERMTSAWLRWATDHGY